MGPLGQLISSDLTRRGLGRLVACVDSDASWRGVRLDQRVPGAPALNVAAELSGVDWETVDACLLTTHSDLSRCAPLLRDLLGRGVSVVSSCEELLFPWLRHADLARELDRLAKERGARLLGTGVNPGLLMDALPAFISAACNEVRSLAAWRIQDARPRRVPFQRKIGAGLSLEQFREKEATGSLRHVGLGESLHFLAEALGVTVERWTEELEPVVATTALECELGTIPAGHASGVRQVARAWVRGREFLTLEFQAAIAQPDPHDRVRVEGDPPIDLVLRGGVHGDRATSAILLNCVRPLLSVAPGLHTMATIPMPTCRSAPAP
jgi:4-hydroxy-tetrahydrodipicolinate reductase